MTPEEYRGEDGEEWDDEEEAWTDGVWHADDGNAEIETCATSAREAAEEYMETGDWGETAETWWLRVRVWQVGHQCVDGEVVEIDLREQWITVTVDPDEPPCKADDHDWCSPHSVVGGCESSPGVWGSGGGVIIKEVCRHCGIYRVTNTWAQCPSTGEQGLSSVAYRDADDTSLDWIDSQIGDGQ